MMTQLRQRMLEQLQRRNYSSDTVRSHIQHVAKFAQHFHRSPDQLGAEHIRQYQRFLIQERKLACRSGVMRLVEVLSPARLATWLPAPPQAENSS